MTREEALERIEFRVRRFCPEANGDNIGECNGCWRYPCNDMKAVELLAQERPHGEWIEKSQFDRLCKNCGQQHIGVKQFANFCPNCGRDNRPRENNSSSMIINGKYSENVEYGTRIEIGEMKGGE